MIDPLPGNEPANPNKYARAQRDRKNRREQEKFESRNVTPEEIGEADDEDQDSTTT